MAKDTLNIDGIPLFPQGMNDNLPLSEEIQSYQTRGINSTTEQYIERIAGKELIKKYNSPILSIHGDLKDFIFVETKDQLLLITEGDFES